MKPRIFNFSSPAARALTDEIEVVRAKRRGEIEAMRTAAPQAFEAAYLQQLAACFGGVDAGPLVTNASPAALAIWNVLNTRARGPAPAGACGLVH